MDPRIGTETEVFVSTLATRARLIAKLLKKRSRAASASDPDRMIGWLQSAAPVTEDWPAIEAERRRILNMWELAASSSLLELEADLRESCRLKNWRVDGQWPDFVVEYGVSVQIDETRRRASVGGVHTAANPTAIDSALSIQVPNLVPRNFSSERFMSDLLDAFKSAAGASRGPTPILDLYRTLVIRAQSPKFWRDARPSNFTAFSTDQFRARLSKCLDEGMHGLDGYEVRLYPPLDPKDALFVYQPAERRFGYVGRIGFTGLGAPGE
jgi:hypothetical protein